MSDRAKQWTAIASVLAIIAALALIVIGVDRYETQLRRINWALVTIVSAFVLGAFFVYRWNDEIARYNVIDLVMNPKTGRPDPYRHLLFIFAGLTVWAVIQVVLAKEWGNLNALLLGALGFFVAKPAIDGISDAIASRTEPAPPDDGGLVRKTQTTEIVRAPAPAEAATDVGATPKAASKQAAKLKAKRKR